MSIATAATAADVARAVARLIKVYTPTAITDDERLVLLEYVTGRQTDNAWRVGVILPRVCRRVCSRSGLRGLGVFKTSFKSFVKDMREQLDDDDPRQRKMKIRLKQCGNVVSDYRD